MLSKSAHPAVFLSIAKNCKKMNCLRSGEYENVSSAAPLFAHLFFTDNAYGRIVAFHPFVFRPIPYIRDVVAWKDNYYKIYTRDYLHQISFCCRKQTRCVVYLYRRKTKESIQMGKYGPDAPIVIHDHLT